IYLVHYISHYVLYFLCCIYGCFSFFFFFSSRRRHTRWPRDWSSDVCSSDLSGARPLGAGAAEALGRPLEIAERSSRYRTRNGSHPTGGRPEIARCAYGDG